MRLLCNLAETRLAVDTTRRSQILLRPQHNFLVPHFAREPHTLGHQLASYPQPASVGLNQQQTEFGGGRILRDQENTTRPASVGFRYPATLACRVELAQEFRH